MSNVPCSNPERQDNLGALYGCAVYTSRSAGVRVRHGPPLGIAGDFFAIHPRGRHTAH
jgi:hypothetical protein